MGSGSVLLARCKKKLFKLSGMKNTTWAVMGYYLHMDHSPAYPPRATIPMQGCIGMPTGTVMVLLCPNFQLHRTHGPPSQRI